MELLTPELREQIPKLYSQEQSPDPTVWVKFFTPWSNWTWYVTEGQQESAEDGGDFTFFGWVVGHDRELGYFSLMEMQSITGPGGLRIERDLYFEPCPLSEVKRLYEPGGTHNGQ